MSKELQIFENPEFGRVRTVQVNNETWLVGKDIAVALRYQNPSKALSDHVDEEDKGVTKCYTPGGVQEMTIINESGLYSLVLSSKLPGAKRFRRWVTKEVLPSIRRTGQYSAQPDRNKDALAEAKLNNSRARMASVWLKLGKDNPIPQYKAVCAHYASTVLAGKEVLPLPETAGRTYTATEVGRMLGGVSAHKVGTIANQNGLKTPEYGVEVWDKSPNSPKQVAAWRYNDKAIARLKEIIGGDTK